MTAYEQALGLTSRGLTVVLCQPDRLAVWCLPWGLMNPRMRAGARSGDAQTRATYAAAFAREMALRPPPEPVS